MDSQIWTGDTRIQSSALPTELSWPFLVHHPSRVFASIKGTKKSIKYSILNLEMGRVVVLSLGKNILGGYYCFPCFTASIRYYIYVMFSLLQAWWSTCTDCAQVPFCFSLEENVCCRPYSGEILCFHQGKNSERWVFSLIPRHLYLGEKRTKMIFIGFW